MLKQFVKIYFFVFGRCFRLLSFGLFKKEGRVSLIQMATSLGFYKNQQALILPIVTTETLGLDEKEITIGNYRYEDGNTSLYELCIINSLIVKFKPANVFEIGTFDGRTALNMALNSTATGKVFTLDLPKELLPTVSFEVLEEEVEYINKNSSGNRLKNSHLNNKVVQLLGDSASFDFDELPQIDFIFIDGSHAFDYVISDSLKSINKIVNNGIIVWHDYGVWEDVTKALNFLYKTNFLFKSIKQIENTSMVILQVKK